MDRCPTCGFLPDETGLKLAEVQEKNEALQAAAVGREATNRALKNQLVEKRDTHRHKDAIEDLARFWNKHCRNGKARAAAKGERFDKTAARLNEGWTVAELTQAILGAWHDPIIWKGQKWNDLKQIMKDASTVEQYIARAPSTDELIARDLVEHGPPDESVWLQFELDQAKEWLATELELRERDQLTREIMAGEGPLLDFHRRVHEARLERHRPALGVAA